MKELKDYEGEERSVAQDRRKLEWELAINRGKKEGTKRLYRGSV